MAWLWGNHFRQNRVIVSVSGRKNPYSKKPIKRSLLLVKCTPAVAEPGLSPTGSELCRPFGNLESMARPIARGVLSFGLVAIPVEIHTATRNGKRFLQSTTRQARFTRPKSQFVSGL
jgi:hypothetical protein